MKVYVNYSNKRWKKYKIDFEKIANVAAPKNPEAEVSIILTDDKEIHQLNKQYRNIDKPTNVLSFELGDDVLLGDIYISLDTVKREAAAANISVAEHTAHMVVHGMLHLLGFDHINDADAAIMESREIKLMKHLGYKNPYADECVACNANSKCPGDGLFSFVCRPKNRENGFGHYLMLFLLGTISALGFAPFNMWWATMFGIGAAYYILCANAKNVGFFKSLMRAAPFGAAYCIAMFWWSLHSIYVVPELAQQFAIWTVPAIVGFAIAGAIVFGMPFALTVRARTAAAARPFVFAGFWTFILWMREWAFTGFPWNPIANISMPFPVIANSMSLWGALGLTFVVVGISAAGAEIIKNKKCAMCWISGIVFVAMLVGGAIFGAHNIRVSAQGSNADGVVVRIVQPARSQSEKMDYSSRENRIAQAEEKVKELLRLASMPGEYELVVFPETTYPFVVADSQMPLAHLLGRPVIVGAMSVSDGVVYNSMVVGDARTGIQKIYNKSHLVPFGEYAPMGGLLPAPVNLGRGAGADVLAMDVGNRKFLFAPAICYEIIFSDSLVLRDMPRIDAIVNITNDTWFGNTPGVYQHLDMVRRYAIESGLPVIRANYSGISAFVGADGAVISMLPVGITGVLDGFVWGAHVTPYHKIGRDLCMVIILIVAIAGAGVMSRKQL